MTLADWAMILAQEAQALQKLEDERIALVKKDKEERKEWETERQRILDQDLESSIAHRNAQVEHMRRQTDAMESQAKSLESIVRFLEKK